MLRAGVLLSLCFTLSVSAADIDGQGFLLRWLILGPYVQTGGNNPGEAAQALDYLTDGTVTQMNIKPFAGMVVDTNYALAASTGLLPQGNPAVNPTGKPTWFEYVSAADTIDFQSWGVFNRDVDDCMAYACVFVKNLTGNPINGCRAGVGSDDGIQVIVNQTSVWNHSVPRGVGNPGQVQDWTNTFNLPAGVSRLMVKVFEGGGGWAFRLKLEDSAGQPLLGNRIALTTLPYGPCPETVAVFADSWLREVIFLWDASFSEVSVYEGGQRVAHTTDALAMQLRVPGVSLGMHTYEFRTRIGDDEPPCEPLDCFAELTPLWPAAFQGEFDELTGLVNFAWRNLEGYYDALKIQHNGTDLLDMHYTQESAQIGGQPAGTQTYTLVAALEGYQSEGITCEVDITGPPPAFRRGDANADGSVNVADGVHVLAYLFAGGPAGPCPDALDSNDDGKLDISDAIGILRYLFASVPMPAPGAEACGQDPTPDTLGFCNYPQEFCR